MLNEIQSFFEKLRQKPAPAWPEGVSEIGPDGRDLRAESEHHWRLMMQSVDELEAKIVDLYGAGADKFRSREFLGLSLVRKCFGRPCERSLSPWQFK
jgi:hypothetical protein